MLARKKKKTKMVENAFLTDQCTKFIFALLVCWFYLIRTQAFSVFSRCRVVAPQWDRTIHTHVRESESATVWTKETACGWPRVHFFLIMFVSLSFPNLQLFIASFPLTYCREDFCYVTGHVLCCPTFLKQSWHQRAAAALYLHKLVDVCVVLTV